RPGAGSTDGADLNLVGLSPLVQAEKEHSSLKPAVVSDTEKAAKIIWQPFLVLIINQTSVVMPLAVQFIFLRVFDKLLQSFIEKVRVAFGALDGIDANSFVGFRKVEEMLPDLLVFFQASFNF